MKYVDEFRDGDKARAIAGQIRVEADPARTYHLMEFCGGHTHAIFRYGIPGLLPDNVKLIHGPGCPVCVLPIGRLDMAVELARRPDLILCTYGDMLRVPGSGRVSLMKVRAEGTDVRMLYSPADAIRIAQQNPDRQVVFFAIGFETTTPPTALVLEQAKKLGLTNFSVFCNHVLTPAAMHAILNTPEADSGALQLDGFIGPAHVSTVIGSAPYEPFPEQYAKPVVIAGFEPLDVLQAILMLIRQLNDGRCEVENEFTRAVTREGNAKANALVARVFELRKSFEWRGLGAIPESALQIRADYAEFDAEKRFALTQLEGRENKACECPAILRGVKNPRDCTLFGDPCTPDNPLGSCMVSSEGACAAYYSYGRLSDSTKGESRIPAQEVSA
ncbi:hydrogenase formation protein HypD [Marinobacterium sp. D7]|uniref:hydrogenase formation protein HypD n=1 Tax=Marinobacterium ramblicola TaxID=2849041 RepID=UPI001C2D8F32|nr:hydrogenase formation protein HypD [Marinobacterium ramblicola]MBV1790135.1 hydrogenase formation protein HypD [Marinobacterium ramblicola]